MTKCRLPRIVVEVNSNPPGGEAVDHHRLIIQGASVVRFANSFLDAYKAEKDFIFVAIFFTGTAEAVRYLLYQKKESVKVCTRVLYSFILC